MIRKLEIRDAEYMHEWMTDETVVCHLQQSFASKTLNDCQLFINNSVCDEKNVHMAIVDNKDEYMGTVSLKNIDYINMCAEFAITVRACAMGKGYSKVAMHDIGKYAKENLQLRFMYWYVLKENHRAIRFYDKNGYMRVDYKDLSSVIEVKNNHKYFWYIKELK